MVVVLSHDHALLKMMRRMLGVLGFETYTDEPRAETVRTIGRLQPALLILDVELGYEQLAWSTLRALREYASTRAIRLVACAATQWLLESQRVLLQRYNVPVLSAPYDVWDVMHAVDVCPQGVETMQKAAVQSA